MKKALKIILWIVLIFAIGGLVVSTYLNVSEVNERWNENIAPWIGGASLAVAATTVIQLIVNYASKSNLDLGIKDFTKASDNFNTTSAEMKNEIKELNEKYNEELTKMKELIEHYEKTLKEVAQANKKLDVLITNEVEIAKHDETMVRDNTTAKLIQQVEELKNEEEN